MSDAHEFVSFFANDFTVSGFVTQVDLELIQSGSACEVVIEQAECNGVRLGQLIGSFSEGQLTQRTH